jgi:hypothetical protein
VPQSPPNARALALEGLVVAALGTSSVRITVGRAGVALAYSPAGTRFKAFFTVPRSVMIFCCKSVMA